MSKAGYLHRVRIKVCILTSTQFAGLGSQVVLDED